MKFEIHETIQTADPEVVLRALEMCSREISSEVVRSGDRITLQGVGPSPRSKNRQDTTVFCVNAENNETVIRGEVNFQASALLGGTSQQEVVRSKLDELFEQMKAQIHLDSMRVAAYTAARRSAASSTTVIDGPGDQSPIELRELDQSEEKLWSSEEKTSSAVGPETLIDAMSAAPDLGWGAAALIGIDEPQEIVLPDPDQRGASRHPHIAEPSALPPIERGPAGTAGVKDRPERTIYSARAASPAAGSARLTEAEQTLAKEPTPKPKSDMRSGSEEELTWEARIPPNRLKVEEDQTSGWRRFAWLVTVLVVLLALAGGAYRLHWLPGNVSSYLASTAAKYVPAPTSPAPIPPAPKATEIPLPNTAPLRSSPPESTAEPAVSNAELKRWLQEWAASMQTRDANAQASFYADKLDRYLDQRNVGRSAVLRDREATNRMRKGLWTVKMEDIVIERHTESEAEVRLMKHFIDEPEKSEILESFVPTRLSLKRIDGQWKITSEQDQPTISVSPWKAQGGTELYNPGVRETQSNSSCSVAALPESQSSSS